MAKHRRKSRRQHARQSSSALLQNGLKAFRGGDYDGAIEMWERAGQQTPQMRPTSALAQVYFRRGLKRIYGQPSDLTGGIDDLSRAVGLLPDDPGYTYHLGLAAHRLGELGRAIPAYRAARKGGGEFANRAAYPLALALSQQGQEPSDDPVWSALSAEEQAMLCQSNAFRRRPYTLSPDAPPLWRGLASLDAGDHERARALLDEALQCPTGPVEEGMAHYYLGVLAAWGEDWDAARQHWNRARSSGLTLPRLEDAMGEVYHRLAEDRLESGDAESALAAGMEAVRHKPDDKRLGELTSQAHQRLAYEAASAGQWMDATQHWEAADHAEGGSFRLAYNLALAYERAEDFVAAGEKWREALRRRPRRDDHPDAIDDEQVSQLWRRAAEAYGKAGEYDEAVRVYRQAVKWNPDHVDTRMALAEMLLANGQPQAAENELGRILERDPDNIPALLRRGEAIAASGSWWWGNSPVSCWERVLELEPDNATARQLLADFYQDQADYHLSWAGYERAAEMYRQALEYQPGSGRILAALGGCHLRMNEQAVAQDYFEQALAAAPEDLSVYDQVIHAWLDVGQPDQAWEVMAKAEAAIETIPYDFYIHQAYYCIQQGGDLARPWLARAVEKAPPGEPAFMVIGEMAVTTRVWDIAREYLEQAVAAGQVVGQAHLMLGIVDAQEGDLGAAKKHWAEAEQIARRERDQDLLERAQMARVLFSGPPGLASLLMSLSGGPFGPSFPDFYDEDEDGDLFFFGEDDDDDEFWD
jgi:tetratricopeptide (TPR) repeat protein